MGTEPCLYFILLSHTLLLPDVAWMHAGCAVSPSQGDAGRISLIHVFVHKAEDKQQRCSSNESRSVGDPWANVISAPEGMPASA